MIVKILKILFIFILVLQAFSVFNVNKALAEGGCNEAFNGYVKNLRTGAQQSYYEGTIYQINSVDFSNFIAGDTFELDANIDTLNYSLQDAYAIMPNGEYRGFNIYNYGSAGHLNTTYTLQSLDDVVELTANCDATDYNVDRITETNTIILTFSAGSTPDFALSCSPSTQTINPGSSASYNLSTSALSGFSSGVSFSHNMNPNPGVSASISYTNNGAAPNATTTATVTTGAGLAAGTYTITFTGTGGGQTHTCSVNLVVNAAITLQTSTDLAIYQQPTVVLQVNGSNASSLTVGQSATLSWTPTATNSGSACTAGGSWSGAKSSTPGTTYTASTGALNTPGTYTYTLYCSGALSTNSATQSVTVTVTGTPDFTFTCSPSTQTISAGGSASFNISTTSQNGYSSAVTFSHSFSPNTGTLPTVTYGNNGAVPSATTYVNVWTGLYTTPGTYTITFTGTGGGKSHSCNVTFIVNTVAPTADIKANSSDGPINVSYNTAATISWTSTAATSCTVSPLSASGTSGSQSSGSLTVSTTYTLTCNGPGGSATDTVTVNVINVPDFTINCTPTSQTINLGGTGTFNLTTTAQNGYSSAVTFSHSFSPNTGTLPTVTYGNNGAVPSATTYVNVWTGLYTTPGTYTITFTGTGGGKSHSCNVTFIVNTVAPTADIKANSSDGPINVSYNTAATISWTSTAATSCTVSPLSASGTSGSQSSGNLTTTTTYTLSCSGPGGSATDTVTVNVNPDFSVSCTPATQTVAAGSTSSFNLSTTALSGFSSAVTFSHSFSPNTGTLPIVSYTNNGAVPSAATTAVVSTTTSTTLGTYTITFTGTGGGQTHTCAVNFVVNQPQPPNPPPSVNDVNSGGSVACGTIQINWTISGTGPAPEGFKVYRRAATTDAWQQLGANVLYGSTYSVTDLAPLNPNGSNYYAVSAYIGVSESVKVDASVTPIVPVTCSSNISVSDKDLIQVNANTSGSTAVDCNGQSDVYQLPSNRLLKTGDTVKFKVNICNTGNQTLTNVRVVDTTTNLSNLSYVSSSGNCVTGFNAGTKTFSVSNIAPSGVCSIIMTATISNPGGGAGTLYRFQNTANIQSDQRNLAVYTPPYLFAVGSGVPDGGETTP